MSFVHNKACPGVGHAASWPMSFTSTIISRVRAFNHPRSESLHSFNLIGIVVSLDVEYVYRDIRIFLLQRTTFVFFSFYPKWSNFKWNNRMIEIKLHSRAIFIYLSSAWLILIISFSPRIEKENSSNGIKKQTKIFVNIALHFWDASIYILLEMYTIINFETKLFYYRKYKFLYQIHYDTLTYK